MYIQNYYNELDIISNLKQKSLKGAFKSVQRIAETNIRRE